MKKGYVAALMLMLAVSGGLVAAGVAADEPGPDFAAWLEGLRVEACAAGISPRTVDAALDGLQAPLPGVVDHDRKQPESTQRLADYVAARVSEKRLAGGRSMLASYPTWLGRIERRYGVQRRFLVALWGIESNYGANQGTYPVVRSLATLAYDGRRGPYFRQELLEALKILDAGHIPLESMNGSWAGAMGQCQFMPSSFRRFAVDANGNGRIDIWTSVPDVLGSTANYLAKAGWNKDQTWGRPVRLPKKLDSSLAGLETRLPLSRWQALGVRRADGGPLPRAGLKASLIIPDGPDGPAYLVYDNFRVLLSWNRSQAFAVAVGTLADRLGR